jgi:hypothetical protein
MSCLPNLDQLPIEILESTRAVVWKYELRDGKSTKVPYQARRSNERADITNPVHWAPFDVAFDAVADGKADGVGIVLGDGMIGIDLDHCRNAETGEITAEALALIATFDTYTEISPSQTGVHMLPSGDCPPDGKKRNGVELYSRGRYFTVTGAHLPGTPRTIHDRTPQVTALHAELSGPEPAPRALRPVQPTSLDDEALLDKARSAKNGALFTALWNGDLSAYGGDDSAADLALCNLLAFWTRCDADRMDRLFRQSGLMREKWASRRADRSYGAITIERAIADCTNVYEPAITMALDDDPADEAAPSSGEGWPVMPTAAFIGPFGELVALQAPQTEADPVALLLHHLVLFGSLAGRTASMRVGADVHHLNENLVCAGDTSIGRKGMAYAESRAFMALVDPTWAETRLLTGLSSGEGLIYAVRDAVEGQEPVKVRRTVMGYQAVIQDAGVTDKRLAIIESEFGKTLRVSRREGNTLSAIVRLAWEHGTLRVMTRNNPLTATGAHISIVAHVTPRELRQELKTTDMASGFINRFIVALVRRSHCLPDGGSVDGVHRDRLVRHFQHAAAFAQDVQAVTRDPDAHAHWHAIYPHLTRARAGLVGAVCNRASAHVLRLSMLYALADCSSVIRLAHQQAALAVWTYAEASALQVFGQRTGQRLADYLLGLLRQRPEGLTRTQIRDALGRNRHADEISEALQLLLDYGVARCIREPVDGLGRPTTRWFAK